MSLAVQQPFPTATALHVSINGHRVVIQAPAAPSQRSEGVLNAEGLGALPVRVVLVSGGVDTIAAVAFTRSFERDFEYGMGADVARVRPIGLCIGTILAAPLRSRPGDTLFVSISGLPKDAVC